MTDSDVRACTAAAALNILGEKWSLLVVRELAYNVHRFDEIARKTGAPRDILTSRLRRLEGAGIIERRQYHNRPVRYEYYLTQAGEELRPVLLSLAQWGARWAAPATVAFTHSCGETLELVHTCKACGGEVTGRDLRARSLVSSAA